MLHRTETTQTKEHAGDGGMIRSELFRRLRRGGEGLIASAKCPAF